VRQTETNPLGSDSATSLTVGPVNAFTPAALFNGGEEGAWYEPSTTTAFLSSTDLTPCGYGDGCGFLLDKSKGAGYADGSFTGLGSELVTNGAFGTDTTGWSATGNATIAWSSDGEGSAELNITGSGGGIIDDQTISVEVGKVYEHTISVRLGTYVGDFNWAIDGQNEVISPTSSYQTFTRRFVASDTDFNFAFTRATATTGTFYIDNISVREIPGNHATQVTAGARPILARVPEGGRRNLLEKTEEFNDPYWNKAGAIVDPNEIAAPDGTITADKIVETAVNNFHFIRPSSVPKEIITWSIWAKEGERRYCVLTLGENATPTQGGGIHVDLRDGTVISYVGSRLLSHSVTPSGNGWYLLSVTVDNRTATTTPYAFFFLSDSADHTIGNSYGADIYTGDGTSGVYIWGAQAEISSTATAYQKVVDEYDITEAGVTSLEYLSFDGVDDFLQNTSLTHNSTMHLSVSAYVETSIDGRDSIFYFGTGSGAYEYGLYQFKDATNARGFNTWTNDLTGSTPATLDAAFVDSLEFNNGVPLSAGNSYFRNGTEQTLSVITGTPASRTMVSGFRIAQGGLATSGQNLIGRIYGIVLINRAKTTSERQNTETYLAAKSGVVL
jgi:hypothetical protein